MEHFAQIRALVSQVKSPHVRALLDAFLDDPELQPAFLKAPAAMRIHHAYLGGLCEHTLSVLQLGWRICDHYPQLDRDLITAGCLLHDFGKVRELSPEPGGGYTDEGRLVGHIVTTCQLVREKAAGIEGFPRELEWRITHLIAAHHGRREYGSPKEPVTLEAMVVHALDDLDSQMSAFALLFQAAEAGAAWTDRKNQYGRALAVAQPAGTDDRRFGGQGLYRREMD
ncbi:MAG TPA: HD domain-containing protein [Myxococcales bacterium]|nr:HD domain-containing protein [Myxococcales bacterium]